MSTFSILSDGDTSGGGNERFLGTAFGNANPDKDGVPKPGSQGIPGVIIESSGPDIVIVFPDTGVAGPGFENNPENETSPADSLLISEFSRGLYVNVDIPLLAYDTSSVETSPTPESPENVEEENESLIINIIDDDSISLLDISIEDRPCPLPVFNLSFESNLSLSAPFYNEAASSYAIEYGDAAAGSSSNNAEEEAEGSIEQGRERVEWAESVAQIIDSIISVDKNIKHADLVDTSNSKWTLGNINALDDATTSILATQREVDFGYYINETNFRDFAQTTPGLPGAEEIVKPFDVSTYVSNGLSSSVYGYNSNIDNESDIVSLEMVDVVQQGYAEQYSTTMMQNYF